MKPSLLATTVLASGALILSACGSSSVAKGAENDSVSAAQLTVNGVWARATPSMASTGAAYMVVTSPIDDRLVGASVDASIAGRVEIHEVVMADGSREDGAMIEEAMTDDSVDHGESESESAMVMQQVEAIELPAGAVVALEPGGYHIMVLELAAPLVAGERFDLALDFANAGPVTVSVEVRTEAP